MARSRLSSPMPRLTIASCTERVSGLGVFKPTSAHAVRFGFLLFSSLLFALVAGACSNGGPPTAFVLSEDSGPGSSGDATTRVPPFNDGGGILVLDTGTFDANGELTVTPANKVLDVTSGLPMPTLQFTASLNGNPVGATWAIDRGELGAIASTGILTPTGTFGGVANITATYGALTASAPVTIFLHVSQSGGSADAGTDGGGFGGIGGVGGEGPGGDPGSTLTGVLNGTPTADPGLA